MVGDQDIGIRHAYGFGVEVWKPFFIQGTGFLLSLPLLLLLLSRRDLTRPCLRSKRGTEGTKSSPRLS